MCFSLTFPVLCAAPSQVEPALGHRPNQLECGLICFIIPLCEAKGVGEGQNTGNSDRAFKE